ncbi:MAG: PaaI family thioesterase [Acidimicrobiia bacterium]|nr:PaaI family thioesterase [Acidimicrobiia bacterium]
MTLPTLETFTCFACSPHNPRGLHLRFEEGGPDRITAVVELPDDVNGLGGVAHGGIVATVLDEAMAWVLYRHRAAVYVTATMTQRFRGTVRTGVPLAVEATIDDDGDRRIRASARIADADRPDRPLAEGSGLYVRAPDRTLQALPDDQRRELEALFQHFRDLDDQST